MKKHFSGGLAVGSGSNAVATGRFCSTRSFVFKVLTFAGLIWLVVIIYMLGCIDKSRFGSFSSGSSNLDQAFALEKSPIFPTQQRFSRRLPSKFQLDLPSNSDVQFSSTAARNLMQSVAIAKRRIAAKTNELRFLLHTVSNLSSSSSGGRYSHAETLHALEELTDVLTDDLDVVKTPTVLVEATTSSLALPATQSSPETDLEVEIEQKTEKNSVLSTPAATQNIFYGDDYSSEPLVARKRRKRRKVQKPALFHRNSDGFESLAQDAKQLMQEVQNRLYTLQNPADSCLQKSSKTVVCKLNKGCGFGCQIHHVNYCLVMAYGLNRTLLLDERHWRYSRHGWAAAFRPLSQTCKFSNQTVASVQLTSSASSAKNRQLATSDFSTLFLPTNQTSNVSAPAFPNAIVAIDWRGAHSTKNHDDLRHAQQINLPIIDALRPKPAFTPPAVPADLAPRILAIHAQPFIWWIGQIMWFLWQLNEAMTKEINALVKRYKFNQSPIVGIHIRRTDKIGVEAALHSTDEYMKAASEYFDRLDNIQLRRSMNNETAAGREKFPRRAFVATDDAAVLLDLRKNYPGWEILGDEQTAQSAAVSRRNSDASLSGIVRDIELLSRTDFIVCTFSSQVCRVAYELMQARQTALYGRDASESVRSLDDIYYYGGQNQRDWQTIVAHRARNAREIDLELNDLVGVAGNHWDGLSFGVNRRTQRKGLFPSFKVVEKVLAVEMPAKDYV